MSIKLIIGLGNPGNEYKNTRHNLGFFVIDQICDLLKIKLDQNKFEGVYSKIKINNQDFIIAKPSTYMNLSGQFVSKIVNFYKIDSKNIVIIHDDLDLPNDVVRFKTGGSAGGHNGIKSIIESLGTTEFNRIKIGIGRPTNNVDVKNYVLNKLNSKETIIIKYKVDLIAKVLIDWSQSTFAKIASDFSISNKEKK